MAGHCICTNHSCKFWTESVGASVTTTSASLSLTHKSEPPCTPRNC
jgi:hypothetical protein